MQLPQNKPRKKWWKIIFFTILTFLAIFLVAAGFYIFDIIKKINNDGLNSDQILSQLEKYATPVKNPTINGKNNYWLGSSKPKVTIVEFIDFNCLLCKNSFSKTRAISLKYKDSVKIIIRDYPIYEGSLDLALAARCAGEQGLFWVMHDKLFINQKKFELSALPELANQIGADITRFNSCLNGQKYLNDIKKDYSDGESLKINGTPTWFINGYKIDGDIPYDLFIQIIEELIK